MDRLKSFRERWLPVFVAFVIGAMLTGVAAAHPGFPEFLHAGHSDTMAGTLTAQGFKYSTPKTNKIVVPGAAFIPDDDTTVFSHGGYSGEMTLGSGDEAEAPVYFPQGATVTKVALWYDDSGAGADNAIELHLEANDLTGGHDDMALIDSLACAAGPCVVNDVTISPNVVNNNAVHYGLWLSNETGSDITIFKVVITYTTTSVGPATGAPAGDWRPSDVKSHEH